MSHEPIEWETDEYGSIVSPDGEYLVEFVCRDGGCEWEAQRSDGSEVRSGSLEECLSACNAERSQAAEFRKSLRNGTQP